MEEKSAIIHEINSVQAFSPHFDFVSLFPARSYNYSERLHTKRELYGRKAVSALENTCYLLRSEMQTVFIFFNIILNKTLSVALT